jgi:hypothetical protein
MHLTEKKRVEELLGKPSFWTPKEINGLCEYIAGIEQVDEVIGEQGFLKLPSPTNFSVHPGGLAISILPKYKMHYFALKSENIHSIVLEKGDIIDSQSRSVVGRAIVGGLLLGPLGAVVGGMSGSKDKIIKENDSLLISFKQDNEQEQALLFKIKKGKTKKVFDFFKENYSGVFSLNG